MEHTKIDIGLGKEYSMANSKASSAEGKNTRQHQADKKREGTAHQQESVADKQHLESKTSTQSWKQSLSVAVTVALLTSTANYFFSKSQDYSKTHEQYIS